MADDLMERGPGDRKRIDISQDWECRYWSRALGVSEEQLKAAVGKVGTSAQAVRDHLQGRSHGDPATGKGSTSASGRSNRS